MGSLMTQKIKDFDLFIKKELNKNQRSAVKNTTGPLLVVAGAGSGKTRVITARICNLILNHAVAPSSIIALTFTNKAAREMKERIVRFLPKSSELPFIGTFHSYCLRLLKLNRHLLEYPSFSIMDSADQEKLLTGIIKKVSITKKLSAKSLTYTISQIKTASTLGTSFEVFDPVISSIVQQYEKEKKASHCFDFDDLLLEMLKLFKSNKEFKERFQQEIRHILVDEYQDTNAVQHALLKQMAIKSGKILAIDSICVVGDEDQSIYSWRGATVDNILNFKKDFAKTKTVTIEQNYRSVKQILTIANEVIKHNKKRNPKKLWSDKEGKNRVALLSALSGYQESDLLAYAAQTARKSDELNSIAILYRTHFQSRIIEEALLRNSIPYKIIGGIQFYERKEIKDLLAYLKLIVNPFDRVSLARVINTPNRGLGDKFQEMFFDVWDAEPLLNCKEMGDALVASKKIKGTKAAALKGFLGVFTTNFHKEKPSIILDAIIARTQYLDYLKTKYDKQDAEAKIDNVKELLRALMHFEQTGVDTAAAILEEIALMQEKMHEQTDENCIQLMTLHAAKGLEFDMVMLGGLEEGLLPSSRSLHDSDAVEEERRLFYVGITRARERLLLTHSKYRHTYGNMTDQLQSRFIDEIPGNLVLHEDCAYWKAHNSLSFFNRWLGIKQENSTLTFGSAQKTSFKDEIRSFGPPKSAKKNTSKTSARKNAGPALRSLPSRKAPGVASSYAGHGRISEVGWKKNQPVQHVKFGIGIVEKVEKKGTDKFYITARFKLGIKKIDAQFLKKV